MSWFKRKKKEPKKVYRNDAFPTPPQDTLSENNTDNEVTESPTKNKQPDRTGWEIEHTQKGRR